MTVKKPNFLVLGAPKCGTTSLQYYFEQHPDVFVPFIKEANYFAFDIPLNKRRAKNEQEFWAMFEEVKNESAIGEVSIWYMYSQIASQKIKETLGDDVKLIAMVRNPIQATYSMYNQWTFVGEEDIENFEDALDADAERKAKSKEGVWKGSEFFMYADIYKYTEQLKRYYEIFDKDQIKVVLYDDFRKDTEGAFRDMLRFLEVKQPDYPLNFEVVNAHKKVKNRGIRDFYLKNIGSVRSIAKQIIPNDKVRRKLGVGFSSQVKKLYTDFQEKEAMTPAAHQRLVEIYKPEIEDLSDFLKRDLTHWLK